MFIKFFYLLRDRGLNISLDEWLCLVEALDKGLAMNSLLEFYYLCRNVLIKNEADYDKFDLAFAEYFQGVERKSQMNFGSGCIQRSGSGIFWTDLTGQRNMISTN